MVLPTINKELRFSSLGGDLEILEKEVPALPANELLVKVHAASINPCDIQLWRSGLVAVVAGDKGMGKDFSGTVVSVGSRVKGWAEGDDIFGLLFHVVCFRSTHLRGKSLRFVVWSRHFQRVHQCQSIVRSCCQETWMLHPRRGCFDSSGYSHGLCMS
jgi:threonine dehydrogenase-like Zn-dependent dehydrogenase